MIDDNKLGLTARKSVMEELGYKVVAATKPESALDLLGKHAVELVITDYRMPDMTGGDIISLMRQAGFSQPVIIISGFVEALGLNEKNTGANVVIQKSAHEVPHMVRAVQNLLKATRKPPASEAPPSASQRRPKQK
jgi:CheY-like chemotaxis protein